MRSYSKHKKNNIIIGSLLSVLLIMSISYAAFSNALQISGTSSLGTTWDVEIIDITSKDIVGTATNASQPTYTGTTANFNASLMKPSDSITYDITLENKGSLDAVLKEITIPENTSTVITFETSGIKQGDILKSGATATYTIKVTFNSSITKLDKAETSNFEVSFNYVEDDGTDYSIPEELPVMKAKDNIAFWHKSYYISSIDILTTNEVPSNAVESWDVSEAQDGSVMAYTITDPNNSNMYKVYIGGNGGVKAPSNSNGLFNQFTRLTSINLTNLDTSEVTDMQYMFYYDKALTELDVSNFDTSNVTNMYEIFGYLSSVTNINVNGFNTSKVTNMNAMFAGCSKLNTLNLCSFDTSNVTNMGSMFSETTNLTAIYIGNGWNTSNADTGWMFGSSGVSSVTTGQCS